MSYRFVTDAAELTEFCRQASAKPAVAVDTEFVRTKTYHPQLGLVQIFDGQDCVLIDPLAFVESGTSTQCLVDLLCNPQVLKVFHACSEDLDAFKHHFGIYPTPIFDTQFALQLAQKGSAVGYGRMVAMLQNVELEKGESRTDWLQRPLSPEQCDYAADDVLYLLPCYEQIIDLLSAEKQAWVRSEIDQLIVRKDAELPAKYQYLLGKNTWRLRPQQLAVYQRLASFRINQAKKRDITPNFILKEQSIFDVAMNMPQSLDELRELNIINPHEVRKHGEFIIRTILEAQVKPASQLPQPVPRLSAKSSYKKRFATLKEQLTQIAESVGLTINDLASKRQINQVIQFYWQDTNEIQLMGLEPELMVGWRGQLCRQRLTEIMEQA